jgi:hypothetical protein
MPGRPCSSAGPYSILNFILGIWVLISPFVLGYSHDKGAIWNNVISGIIIMVIAAVRIWGNAMPRISWINFIVGIWLIISPWAANFSLGSGFAWNQVIVGIMVAVFSALSAISVRTYTEPPAGF